LAEKRRHHGKYSLEIRDELVIVTVRTNPVPDNGLAGSNADRSPAQRNPHRINWLCGVNLLEAKARMPGITPPGEISLSRLLLHAARQLPEQLSELLISV